MNTMYIHNRYGLLIAQLLIQLFIILKGDDLLLGMNIYYFLYMLSIAILFKYCFITFEQDYKEYNTLEHFEERIYVNYYFNLTLVMVFIFFILTFIKSFYILGLMYSILFLYLFKRSLGRKNC